jgi:Mg-chelatase subunit ChlD
MALACLMGGNAPGACLLPPLDVLDRNQLLRRDRTNECRAAQPIPWRGGEGPCIPDDTFWHTAIAGTGAVLDTGNRRLILRSRQGLLAGPSLGAATSAFRAFVDLDYDSLGQLWALARDGAVRIFDDKGRDRGEMALDGPATGKAESLSVGPDGSVFVLTGDGWVVKYAPEEGPAPTATPTPIITPGPSPRPTRTLSRPTATARPTLPARALPIAAWRVADHAGPGRYRDLAVGRDGRVLVPDADHDRVLVFDHAPPLASPVPTSPPEVGPCRFVPDKAANPTLLRLGDQTEVNLRLGGDCGSRHTALDVVVVVDASCQMSGERLQRTREALVALVDAMTLPDDRLAIVTFVEGAGGARLLVGLTGDKERLRAAARAFTTDCRPDPVCLELAFDGRSYIRSFLWPYGCLTEGRISDGLRAGREALFGPLGRAAAGKALILVSPSRSDSLNTLYTLSQDADTFDPPLTPAEQALWNQDLPHGIVGPVPDREHAMWEAWRLREAGVRVLTTGVGPDSLGAGHPPDQGLLAALAWPADGYRPAGAPADLVPVLAADGRELSARVLMHRLVITDRVPLNMRLVPGSVQPPAEVLPDGPRPDGLIRWSFAEVPLGGPPVLQYRLEPLEIGRWPTNIEAFGDYVDGLDRAGRTVFPVPFVEVEGLPTATDEPTPVVPSPTPTSSPTATRTDTPTIAATDTATPTGTRPPTATPSATTVPSPTPSRVPPRTIYLPVVERWRCQPALRPVDVMLAIDTSSSMTGAKLAAAQRAASTFATLLDLRPGGDRAGVVGFDAGALLVQPLTTSRGAVQAGLASLVPAAGTRIDLGLQIATAELTGARSRPDADRVIVLLTDGRATAGSEDAALAEAARARGLGIATWVIGLGGDVDTEFLARLAGRPDRVRLAPTSADLEAVYRQVASTLVCR